MLRRCGTHPNYSTDPLHLPEVHYTVQRIKQIEGAYCTGVLYRTWLIGIASKFPHNPTELEYESQFSKFISFILSNSLRRLLSLFVETIPPTIRVNKLPVTSIFTTKYSFHLMNNRLFQFPVPLL